MVGDPGIEPGVGLPGGVTIRCRTLQPVAHSDAFASLCAGWIQVDCGGVNRKIACI
jgi:23S rRNA (guanosine2251-2'-O)-methyltransferase